MLNDCERRMVLSEMGITGECDLFYILSGAMIHGQVFQLGVDAFPQRMSWSVDTSTSVLTL